MTDNFDAIVVGAGTSGSIVARRLVDAGLRVQLIEAGGPDVNPKIHDIGLSFGLSRGPEDWAYQTVPQANADGRQIYSPRGKVLGGSHALNAAIWVRGDAGDFDGWEAQGCTGWSWADVLPVYRQMENYHGDEGATRGVGGLIDITADYALDPIQQAIMDAAVEIGLPYNPDYNDGVLDGVSQEQITVRGGERLTTYKAYVRPIEGDPLLTITTHAWVHRLTLDGSTVSGVEYEVDGGLRRSTADIIVLSAGAIDSPRILLGSGIGPAAELAEVGVTPTIDLPGVGKNLHDHYLVPVIVATEGREIERPGTGRSISQTHLFWRSDPELTVPDTQPIYFSIPRYEPWMEGPTSAFTLTGGLLATKSRGAITLTGSDPHDPLAIDPAILDDDRDMAVLVASTKQAREIGRASVLVDGWGARELYPGPGIGDDDLEDYIRKTVTTYHHQVGTCRMGVDELAVVDPTLRVRGMSGLWVIDASIIPTITSGNTNAPAAMIAERGAQFILNARR